MDRDIAEELSYFFGIHVMIPKRLNEMLFEICLGVLGCFGVFVRLLNNFTPNREIAHDAHMAVGILFHVIPVPYHGPLDLCRDLHSLLA